jgi:hypothetical protein
MLQQQKKFNMDLLVMQTRIGNGDRPTISHFCDWSITNCGFSGNLKKQPKSIFIKADPEFFLRYLKQYYPLIDKETRFVLVSGSADRTVPRQIDLRYDSYGCSEVGEALNIIMSDTRMAHWYAENLDLESDRITPIPLGYCGADGDALYQTILNTEEMIDLRAKKLKVFCAHNIREGDQWEKRRRVTDLALEKWHPFVDYYAGVPPKLFFGKLREYPFTICVSGGGLDPSPKAWVALLAGSIPIIERSPTTVAYQDLPVAFVDNWDEDSISEEKLIYWMETLRPFYEKPELRKEVLHKLSMGYWWRRICDVT